MAADRLQFQRFELKFLVRDDIARGIREFVSSYLEIDEFGAGKPNFAYAIHSLYIDSDDLKLYWDTINGNKNRYKLRVRFYDDDPESPAFFELKRRVNDAILKQRAAVKKSAVPMILAGQFPEPQHLMSPGNAKHWAALQNFSRLMLEIRARPKAHVGYYREAWISTQDNSVRVTMDRSVRISPEPGTVLTTVMDNPVTPFEPLVILELKFTGRHPTWFRELSRVFGLRQSGAAKYAEGVAMIGDGALRADLVPTEHPDLVEQWLVRRGSRNAARSSGSLLMKGAVYD
jgi:hypothetical protein